MSALASFFFYSWVLYLVIFSELSKYPQISINEKYLMVGSAIFGLACLVAINLARRLANLENTLFGDEIMLVAFMVGTFFFIVL